MLAKKVTTSTSVSLGRYRITGVLGEGAMGMVYAAFDPLIERNVAIKTINLHLETHEIQSFKERFYREAKAAGGLNYPNIVTIYDIAESDSVAYIAMELLEGLNLRQIIEAGSRPSPTRTARIMAEVADALAYAHDHGVIHRDIKPANIILTKNGLTKITDFGIAQLPATSSTQPGLLIGSPRYMSPEQMTGTSIDGRSDIFSLGAVLYELLTGHAAFDGNDLSELMYCILHKTPISPSNIAPVIPFGLDAIVERALAKNPNDRFQNARDLARALRTFQVSPGIATSANQQGSAATIQSGAIRTIPAKIDDADRLAITTIRRRKKISLAVMGLAMSGVFASVALNQFSLPPIESLPSRSLTRADTNTEFRLLPLIPSIQVATNEAPMAIPDRKPQQIRSMPGSNSSRRNELAERLKELHQQLDDLKTRFTDLHPDVMTKKRHIEVLEKEKRKYEHG